MTTEMLVRHYAIDDGPLECGEVRGEHTLVSWLTTSVTCVRCLRRYIARLEDDEDDGMQDDHSSACHMKRDDAKESDWDRTLCQGGDATCTVREDRVTCRACRRLLARTNQLRAEKELEEAAKLAIASMEDQQRAAKEAERERDAREKTESSAAPLTVVGIAATNTRLWAMRSDGIVFCRIIDVGCEWEEVGCSRVPGTEVKP